MKELKKEYYNIYSEFYNVNKYREMKTIVHHGNNRLSHINRVAKMSFYVSKLMRVDYISSTRGALMHDFFTTNDLNKKKYNTYLKNHPTQALNNSKQYFDVNEVEEDIIVNHMYPLTTHKPKYKESYIVCISDKIVSLYEFVRFRINLSLNMAVIFCIKMLSI